MSHSVGTEAVAGKGPRSKGWQAVVGRLEQFGLIIVWFAMMAVFGYLRPETFLTWANLSTILGSQAVLVVAALGLLIPLTPNHFNLSLDCTITLSSMLVAVLNVN